MNALKPVRKQGIIIQNIGRETHRYSAEGKAVHDFLFCLKNTSS